MKLIFLVFILFVFCHLTNAQPPKVIKFPTATSKTIHKIIGDPHNLPMVNGTIDFENQIWANCSDEIKDFFQFFLDKEGSRFKCIYINETDTEKPKKKKINNNFLCALATFAIDRGIFSQKEIYEDTKAFSANLFTRWQKDNPDGHANFVRKWFFQLYNIKDEILKEEKRKEREERKKNKKKQKKQTNPPPDLKFYPNTPSKETTDQPKIHEDL